MDNSILIIDDDQDICLLLSKFLKKNGYETDTAYTANSGIAKFKEKKFDVVISDYRLGDKSGKDVLLEIKKIKSDTIVIIITGYSHIKTAVDIIKSGAYDYITKPLITDEVLSVLTNALNPANSQNQQSPVSQSSFAKNRVSWNSKSEYIIGQSKAIREIYHQIDIVAPTDYSVIIYGETGTGKEVIARTIHEKSRRHKNPFIAIDCGTISNELSGSALFGHVKGAFTGALFDKDGYFELANTGTIFLDEITNLSYETQAALLRVIQERKFQKVGGTKPVDLDIRIIVASNDSLQEVYQSGKFREDLYHRFNEFTINLPALRNRKEDIPLFAEFFLQESNKELGKRVEGFDPEVIEKFTQYSWPGNLRECRNVVRRAVLLTSTPIISIQALPIEITSPVFYKTAPESPAQIDSGIIRKDLKNVSSKAEFETIMNVLKEVNFNKSKAAEILNIDRKTLYNKIKNYEKTVS
jgi:two-component system response regulator HydG